jgi:hypothetical protein
VKKSYPAPDFSILKIQECFKQLSDSKVNGCSPRLLIPEKNTGYLISDLPEISLIPAADEDK